MCHVWQYSSLNPPVWNKNLDGIQSRCPKTSCLYDASLASYRLLSSGGSISQINSSGRNLNFLVCRIYSPSTIKDRLSTWTDLRKAIYQNLSCTLNWEKGHVKQVEQNLGIRTSSKETWGSRKSLLTSGNICLKIEKTDVKNPLEVMIRYDGQK